jgi:hypothetical protein
MYNGQQVAEFYSNRTAINDFAKILMNEGMLYNVAPIVCERNTIGNNLIDWLYNNYEYENLWADEKGDFGFLVTAKNRETILAELEEAIRTNLIKINSARTANELTTFIITENGKVEAEKNHHDDLIMSMALAVHVYKQILDTTPMEFLTKTGIEEKPPMPAMGFKHHIDPKTGNRVAQQMSEDDFKWLMR